MAQVIYDQVTKRFDGVIAVNDLTLEVKDGEFLVLVGPSGCGKTTALRCLAGLEEVTSGDIIIGDRVVTHVPPKDRDIAMVFQNYALYPHMTVYENMAFGLKLRKVPKQEIDRRVKEVAEMLGIQDLLNRKPRQLSGGQRQRVALGRAIVREPQVFLMDEPLSNLDAKLRVQTRGELIKLQRRLGVTTIYVTHDQVEAMTMGHRIAVMNQGVLQQLDTPENLYDHPANLFVATFIGSPAMNIFPARVVVGDGTVRLVAGDFTLEAAPEQRNRLAEYSGREVLVGIRPEDLIVQPGQVSVDRQLRLPVEIVEPLGSETLVHLRGPAGTIIAKADPHVHFSVGELAAVTLKVEHLHAFDPQTELALF
ncbi:MAG: sn-glycerol-3-phosphate ABC transporter ATP-binding protein UgpC [Thermomicrobium sp.]|uniref:ABC transporter ATP-binding protein n=1 Tax=Thermomicrobium sp. TaxID=1969469 RepID=UPI001B1D6B7B|nr:sn-glycerol-3-phosphate ABC transporter ATP-binding protein UgpC [Thermomicrobium sp.]MBO9351095.1 sn-glycerol-3-phosphate ABC transporter ATP-binding protein UgpC [Thermomicrobium sp.]